MSSVFHKFKNDVSVPPPRKGRFTINLFANIANFSISILVGIWLTPYLIQHLGVAAYGLVPLAVTVTSYMGLFTTAVNSALGRFFTMAYDQQDHAEANRIFNTTFWGSGALLIILLGPALWLSTRAHLFFNVPEGYDGQFVGLFLCTIGVFFLTTLSSSFNIATYYLNRFDLFNAVHIGGTFVKVATILLLFNFYAPRISHVGVALLASAGASLALSVVIWRHLMPTLKVQRSAFSRQTLGQLTGMGGWIFINKIGVLLYLGIDLIVVNKVLGAGAGGQYGAVMTWSSMLRSLAGAVAAIFGPTILSLYARRDTMGLVAYSRRAVKFVGLMVAIPIGLICGFSKPLLSIWVGPAFEPLAPLMMLMTIHLCVNLAVLPLFNIQIAANHVRLPGILSCVMGVGNLGLAILLAGPIGWGMYGVAVAGAVMLTAKNIVFTPIYGAHILGLSYLSFYREIIPVVGATVGLAGAGYWLTQIIQIHSWFELGLAGITLVSIFILITYRILLTSEERLQARQLILREVAISTR